jgi:uncharacterized membrane protein YoaK (UPF0700 family)
MDNEPSTDPLPPISPWKLWQWLLLLTPSLLMVVGAQIGEFSVGGAISGLFTGPVAMVMCILLARKLARDHGYSRYLGEFLCLIGIMAVNFAVAFEGCSMVIHGNPFTVVQ